MYGMKKVSLKLIHSPFHSKWQNPKYVPTNVVLKRKSYCLCLNVDIFCISLIKCSMNDESA